MEERENKMAAGLEAAKQADDSLEEAKLTYEKELNEAKKEAANIVEKANNRLEQRTFKVMSYLEMKTLIEESFSDTNKAGFYLAPWKCNAKNEDFIKSDCKATIRCYPLDLNKEGMDKDIKCFYSVNFIINSFR